jgi:hypothetical protein
MKRLRPTIFAGLFIGAYYLVFVPILIAAAMDLWESEWPFILAALMVSAPAGALLGFLTIRRLWLKCRVTGAYRRKPLGQLWLLAFPLIGLWSQGLGFAPGPTAILSMGVLAGLGTFVVGMALFERKVGGHISFVRGPSTFWRIRWVEVRFEKAANRSEA